MKKSLLSAVFMTASVLAFAQNNPVNFEAGGQGASWTWTVFENGSNPALEVIDNPYKSGINTSDKVAKFTALAAGQPWAGARSVATRFFTFNATERKIKVMVWKSVISDVGIKLETASNWAEPEVKVANTKVNEWEELTFDFTGRALPPNGEPFNGISIFPDFRDGRSSDVVVFFDNISFIGFEAGDEVPPPPPPPAGPSTAAPVPNFDGRNVISIFSNSYTNIPGTELNPNWGQATVTTVETIAGNATLKMAGLNYQGIQLGAPQDVTAMTHVYLNFWSANATALQVFLISPGPVETPVTLTVPTDGWATANIPLTSFAPVALNNVIQFKFVGNGDVYLDNILFNNGVMADPSGEAPALVDFEPNGVGANWKWTTFENASNPAVEFVANPSATGINTSANVAKITALQAGQPWAGARSVATRFFTFNATERKIKVMVWKSVISDVGIKLETASNWAESEVKVANTKVNEWEELTFDFTGRALPPNGEAFNGISIFPDFRNGRSSDVVVYFDNISFTGFAAGDEVPPPPPPPAGPSTAAPVPSFNGRNVISIFSDAYTNIEGTNFNPNWGQATVSTQIEVEGNKTLSFVGLNYQGIEIGRAVDVTQMTHLHLNYWTDNATALQVFLISPGPVETPVTLEVPTTGWATANIPLTSFAPVALNNVFQFKFVGNGNVYLDNILFHNSTGVSNENNGVKTPEFALNQNYPNPFNPSTVISYSLPSASEVTLEIFNIHGQKVATIEKGFKSAGAHAVSFNASNLASGVYLYRLTAGGMTRMNKMMLIK
jgi:hypothetical protein